jgi:hypothetical protein
MSPESCTTRVEIGNLLYELTFTCELAGAIPGRGRLLHYVCTHCREQNPRGRDEWTSVSFPDDMQPDAQERAEAAFKEVQAHSRMHEIIGAWLMAELEKVDAFPDGIPMRRASV